MSWRKGPPINRRLWRRVRREVLERDGWACQCGNGPAHYGNEVDHVQPLDRGGKPYALENLQTLSRGCHIDKTRAENTRPDLGRDGWRKLVSERMEA